jgi:23S rRNA (uracil1939-C5)-methyltransferase
VIKNHTNPLPVGGSPLSGGMQAGLNLADLECIVVDPPREGLHQDVSEFLVSLKQQNPALRLCYISCNPATLARDLALLTVE